MMIEDYTINDTHFGGQEMITQISTIIFTSFTREYSFPTFRIKQYKNLYSFR